VLVLRQENPLDVASFRIIDLNPAAAEITGSKIEHLRGRTLAEFPAFLNTSLPGQCLAAFRSGKAAYLGEISYGDKSIRQGIYALQVFPLPENHLGVTIENVTGRRLAEKALRESEERFRLLIEGVQEYAIFHLDPFGNVVSWNAGAERLKGYRTEEISGKHFSIFYPPEDVRTGKPEQKLAEAELHGHSEDEGWRLRKDGTRFWGHVVITALRDPAGNLVGFAKVTRDMTGQREKQEALMKAKEELEWLIEQRTVVLKRVNQQLRLEIADHKRAEAQHTASLKLLRALAARLQNVREEERTHVAREIHDELGQACTAIKMDLALIARKATKKQARLRAKVDSATQLVNGLITSLRRIASELRPRTLDDLGLNAALEWQAQDFEARTRIPCSLALPEEPIVLDSERSTAIFRIFQESLTNVARHANATQVNANMEKEGNELVLQIRDNGKGFDLEVARLGKSLGLVGMQERALLLDGELKIEAVPGSGTTLTLRIPLAPANLTRDES
jgi:PAS domain S-box-containing protein